MLPGLPTNLDNSMTRALCASSRRGAGCLEHFLSCHISLFFSPSLLEMARRGLKYCLKGPLNPKQPTNISTACQINNDISDCTYAHSDFSARIRYGEIL